jgi:hypothetical protein
MGHERTTVVMDGDDRVAHVPGKVKPVPVRGVRGGRVPPRTATGEPGGKVAEQGLWWLGDE